MLRRLRAAVLALGALLFVAAALLLAFEFTLPLDGLRGIAARVASRTLDAEVRITGTLRLITGTTPGIEVGGLRVARVLGERRIAADLDRARLRLRLWPLLARTILPTEALLEGATFCVSPVAEAPAAACARNDQVAQIAALKLISPEGEAIRFAGSGTLAGEAWQLDLRGQDPQSLSGAAAPVPFRFAADLAGAKMSAGGKIQRAPLSAEADVVFDSAELTAQIRPFGAPFKAFGPLAVRAHARADTNALSLRLDEARLAPVAAGGELSIDWSGPRPRVAVQLRAAKLDAVALYRWLAESIDVTRLQPGLLQRLVIEGVRASDGSLRVEAGLVAAGGAAFDAVRIDGSWSEGKGQASLGARLAAAAITGTFEADVRSDDLSFAASARAQKVALPQAMGIAATAGSVNAKLTARGRLGESLGAEARAAIEVRHAALSLPLGNGENLSITLDTMLAGWHAGGTLRASASGAAFGERFTARVEGADALRVLRGEPWPLSAAATLGPLRLATSGELALRNGKPLAQFDVSLAAERLGSLAAGNPAIAALPLDVRGRIGLQEAGWRVNFPSLRLGNTLGRAQASGSLPVAARPIAAEAAFEVLDLASLAPQAAQAGMGKLWEHELFPPRLALPDADIALRAARLVAPGGVIAAVEANARTRGGRLEQLPFKVEMDGAAIRGSVSADLRKDVALLSATLEAIGLEERHLGKLASDSGMHVKVGSVKIATTSSGNRLRELAANAALRADVQDVLASGQRRGDKPPLTAMLSHTALTVAAGGPVKVAVAGKFAGQPLALEAGAGPLASWLAPGGAPLIVRASGRLADLDLAAKGELPLRGAPGEPAFEVRVSARSLEALSPFLNAELPPVGPVSLEAAKRSSGKAGAAVEVKIALGESRIAGRIASRRGGERPAFEIDLTGTLLRLEDLGTAALAGRLARLKDGKQQASRKPPAEEVLQTQALRDELHRALRRFDARAHLALARITAAGQEAGRADALVTLESGRLHLAPFKFDGPVGGALRAELDVNMTTDDTAYRIAATFDRLRYGPLLRSIDPARDGAGELSLRLNLAGHGALATIASTLDGDAGMVVFPSARHAPLLDLWGGGLLRSLGGALDAENSSIVNCAVAAFSLAGGHAKSAALMLDTTRMRAAGELEVDLASGALKGRVAPKVKRPELFSADVPVVIGGTLAAPRVLPDAVGTAAGAARFFYSSFAYLFDSANSEHLAADGSPDCTAAYGRLAK